MRRLVAVDLFSFGKAIKRLCWFDTAFAPARIGNWLRLEDSRFVMTDPPLVCWFIAITFWL